MEKIFYTYAYLRSKTSKTAEAGTPYYIGKGHGKRAYAYHRRTPVPKDKSKIIILKENLSEKEAFSHEREMIQFYGRKDLGTGILMNWTDGGEGPSNPSPETRRRMVEGRKVGPILLPLLSRIRGQVQNLIRFFRLIY